MGFLTRINPRREHPSDAFHGTGDEAAWMSAGAIARARVDHDHAAFICKHEVDRGTDIGIRLARRQPGRERSEEHTSELQSLMRISYAVFCLKKKKRTKAYT